MPTRSSRCSVGWHAHDTWTIEEVIEHLEDTYGVVYQSMQSYYTLALACSIQLEEVATRASEPRCGASGGKKTQIMELLVKWRREIATGQVRVMFLDECHLLWGDISGYGWSRRK